MKAFFVGLLFLVVVVALTGLGILLFPFLILLSLFLRIALSAILLILAIWLLGKFILYIWEKMK